MLADVFEKFVKTCLNYYGLGPCHYFSSPGSSFDAMLKMTKVELDLISDINMYLFIEKGMRGSILFICKSHSKNKCCDDKEKKSIFYWDTNNSYGWLMNQYLPYSESKWLTKREINNFSLNSISDNSSIGYFLEVDLKYPSGLHDIHNS